MQEDTYWSNIFRRKDKKEISIFTILHKVPIFHDLNKKELQTVERILHRRTYKTNELVFTEEEPGVGMYIIESGTVHITFGQEQKLLAVLGDGDFFGEIALLLESPRTATATAKKPLKLLGFFQPDLLKLLETKPRAGNKILLRLARMMGERLRHTNLENGQLKLKISQFEKELAKNGA